MTNLLSVPGCSSDVLGHLAKWSFAARGAFADNTERAYRGDTSVFASWCASRGCVVLPADPLTVAEFLKSQSSEGRAVATVRRRAATIARLHRAAGLASPCDSEEVRLALKSIAREIGTQQRQATPLTRRDAQRIADRVLGASVRLRDLRDVALVLVGKDLLARASELVSLTIESITFDDGDGTANVALRRRKTSTEAQDCYLGPDAASVLRLWLRRAGIDSGAVFRSINKGGRISSNSLSVRDVGRILKSLAKRAQVDGGRYSGHSLRVGTAVDCVAANIDFASIMQAGGWSSVRMIARYTAKLTAKRGAIARLYHLG